MGTDLRVAFLAVTTGPISPSSDHNDLVALLQLGGFRDEISDLVDLAGNLVPERQRQCGLGVGTKISVL